VTPAFVDEALALDEQRRGALTAAERLKAEKNALTARIAKAHDRALEAQRLRPEIAQLDAAVAQATAIIPELDRRDRTDSFRSAQSARRFGA
jgi:seryl-tRNA synthetase